MDAKNLELVKRLEHYCYDQAVSSYKIWYPMCSNFEEVWAAKEDFQAKCPDPDWKKRCRDRCMTEFFPYTTAAVELNLAVRGY